MLNSNLSGLITTQNALIATVTKSHAELLHAIHDGQAKLLEAITQGNTTTAHALDRLSQATAEATEASRQGHDKVLQTLQAGNQGIAEAIAKMNKDLQDLAVNKPTEPLKSPPILDFSKIGPPGPPDRDPTNGTLSSPKCPSCHLSTRQDRAEPTHVNLADRARITVRTAAAAKAGEFVNLADFLPHLEPGASSASDLEASVTEDGTISFKPRRAKRVIDSYDAWSSAWNNYEALLVEDDPTLYTPMATYRRLIQKADRKYIWSAIAAYDHRFRAFLADAGSMDFNLVDPGLYAECLDAASVKSTGKCYRCKSANHVVADCPLPASAPSSEKKATTTPSGTGPTNKQPIQPQQQQQQPAAQPAWYHQGKRGCNNFQIGRCRNKKCPRAHVCQSCRGDQPYNRCTVCNQGSQPSAPANV